MTSGIIEPSAKPTAFVPASFGVFADEPRGDKGADQASFGA
jgi:hypothetical protein